MSESGLIPAAELDPARHLVQLFGVGKYEAFTVAEHPHSPCLAVSTASGVRLFTPQSSVRFIDREHAFDLNVGAHDG